MVWFIFIGDMLVMLFMTALVIWVSAGANRATLDFSARIPLGDDTSAILPSAHPAAVKEGSNG